MNLTTLPPQSYRHRTSLFLLLSALVHLGLVVSIYLSHPQQKERSKIVEVEFIGADDLIPPPADQAQPRKKTESKNEKQIVEQKHQLNDELDKKTHRLSAFNQKVIQETRADRSGKFNNKVAGGKPDEGIKQNSQAKTEATKSNKKFREKGELPDLKDLMPKFALDSGPKGPELDKDGNPAQTDDYLKDVKSGMQTLLSTREFVYYAYYSRIKESLRQHWEPTVREKVKIIYRTGRSIASSKDRITQVMVTLNSSGELIRVDVLSASGVEALDEAAVEAFKDASPFPNPPKGMIEQDGTVKIRWDFVLEA